MSLVLRSLRVELRCVRLPFRPCAVAFHFRTTESFVANVSSCGGTLKHFPSFVEA